MRKFQTCSDSYMEINQNYCQLFLLMRSSLVVLVALVSRMRTDDTISFCRMPPGSFCMLSSHGLSDSGSSHTISSRAHVLYSSSLSSYGSTCTFIVAMLACTSHAMLSAPSAWSSSSVRLYLRVERSCGTTSSVTCHQVLRRWPSEYILPGV
ncbi:hypothetical protein K466DRAFT_239003 [Polyporus arcularius HHB13444]|uniref:Uncharacterized protein n=1 Tax=Polyporus arcularius HHB13444 TaxID=1314778 RepID=A0A5C3P583_9APHY|nr:hypothetical protein K466DRAFT_239003 [Polyporus arcularius HHB13444]